MAIYFIEEPSDNKLILKRAGDGAVAGLFIIVGLLFCVIGLYLVHPNYTAEEFPGWILLLFGALSIFGGLSYPSYGKKNYPKRMIFDNPSGYLVMEAQDSKEQAVVPYDELDKFIIREEISETSSKYSNHNRNYIPCLLKKDGAKYDLFFSSSEKKAREILEKLEAGVDLTATPKKDTSPVLSPKLQKVQTSQKAGIKWENQVKKQILPYAITFLCIGIPHYFLVQEFQESYGLIAVVSIFPLAFYAILFFNFYNKVYKHLNVVYAVYISSGFFEFGREDKAGRIKQSIKVPLKEIHSILLDFRIDNKVNDSFITIETNSEVEKLKELEEGDETFKKVLESIKLSTNQIKLETVGLSFIEKLNLENWLQKEIGTAEKVSGSPDTRRLGAPGKVKVYCNTSS